MELFHYSEEHLTEIRPCSYIQTLEFKPRGFWVSCHTNIENDITWEEWCKGEEFNIERLRYKHRITIDPNAHIKTLKTIEEIRRFTTQYAEHLLPSLKYHYTINWEKVAEVYSGILIYPYQWGMRYSDRCFWYYPWDCSSGCIWNLDIITSIELIREKETKYV